MAGDLEKRGIVIDDVNYIAVPFATAALAGGLGVTHKIEIDLSDGKPRIREKKLHILNGDHVLWVCDSPFFVYFKGKARPDVSKDDYLFGSDPVPADRNHAKAVAFLGHAAATELEYEAIVHLGGVSWEAADPSIIIDENRHVYVLQRVDPK
jgi:hypothetical protein